MRRGEVLGMTWDELGDDGRTVGLWRKHPEGKRYARVPLLKEAAEIIQRQPKTAAKIFPYKGETVSAAFQRSRNRIGLDVRWHDLRHEGCSRLFERGLDAMTVALFSGHRDINMLRRYTHLDASQVVAAIDSL
jgi:integrase